MPDTLTGLLAGIGLALGGTVAVALLCTKLCPVCDHVLSKGVKNCRYCLHEFK